MQVVIERRPDLAEASRRWVEELGEVPTGAFLITATVQRLSLHVEREFTVIARRHGVGPGDLRILLVLARTHPGHALAPKDLFRDLLITSGAVSKQVDRLVERGLVVRVADPQSLRGVLIELVPAGRAIADDAMRTILTSFCGLEGLSESEAEQTFQTLDRLRRTMERAEERGRGTAERGRSRHQREVSGPERGVSDDLGAQQEQGQS